MPSVSRAQHSFFEAISHSAKFAHKAGVPQSVGRDFSAADDRARITKTHGGKKIPGKRKQLPERK